MKPLVRALSAVGAGCVLSLAGAAVYVASHRPAAPAPQALLPALPDVGPRADGVVVARPGSRATLRAEHPGRVAKISVSRGQTVHAGDILLELDAREEKAAFYESQARIGEARSRLSAAAVERARAKRLLGSGAATGREADDAEYAWRTNRAHVGVEGAGARRLSAVLAKSKVVAPIDGVVVTRNVDVGDTVDTTQPLFEVVDLTRLRVEAEVDELYAGNLATGLTTTLGAEGFTGQSWSGSVEEIGDVVGPRRAAPADPSRPRDVGVLSVWVSLPSSHPLRLGQRVTVQFGARGSVALESDGAQQVLR